MDDANSDFMVLMHRAIRGGVACTCRQLLDIACDKTKGELDRLQELIELLERYRLLMKPPLNTGGFDDERVLISSQIDEVNESDLLKTIQSGETSRVEFKSTLLTDLRKVHHQPGLAEREYISNQVILSSLKTICGMMNASGGSLLLGVENSGNLCGIEIDWTRLPRGRQNFDGWILRFFELVRTKFLTGADVCNFVDVNSAVINGLTVVKVDVIRRKQETYLQDESGDHVMYMRYGTRTDKIKYHEIANFVRERDRISSGSRS